MNTKKRPAGNGANPEDQAGGQIASSVTLSAVTADEFARRVDGAFVVVVKHPNGRLHRRVFLTVASAERAARNASRRGLPTRVILAELKPLYDVAAGGEVR